MLSKIKICSSCKAGEIYDVPADCYVKGKRWPVNNFAEKMIPYRAYLCKDHLEMLLDDGAVLTIQWF